MNPNKLYNRELRPPTVSLKRTIVNIAILLSTGFFTNSVIADSSTSVTSIQGGATWVKQGDNNYSYNNNGTTAEKRALLYSSEAFNSEDGFKLTFFYKTGSIGTLGSHQFSIGLLSDDTDLVNYTGSNPFGSDGSGYGVGINLTNNDGNRGINFANGSEVIPLDASGTRVQF